MRERPFLEYRDTPLWIAVDRTVMDLVASGELSVNTAPEYVAGYLCRELAAKRLIASGGLER